MSKNDIAISVRGLSKSYTIAHNAQKHTTVAESLVHRLRNPLQKVEKETFWALKDVSFDIQKGDVVGVIGRNGAGKSTLLKVLSRITEPTTGEIRLNGRVGSLLEVGTGFHPELTGRENIYLNGAILGMSRREIEREFDAIVDFAGVEQFLDTPVKRYSSGMYVRLAFAVAAHLRSEILIVDEVLAVGDAEFQKKCLGKMKSVAESGRTVLFVSHNMASVKGLCSSACYLKGGEIASIGDANYLIQCYYSEVNVDAREKSGFYYRHQGKTVSIEKVELVVGGIITSNVQAGDSCTVRIHYSVNDKSVLGSNLSVSIMLFVDGQKVANLWTNCHEGAGLILRDSGVMDCVIPKWPFRSVPVKIDIYTHRGHIIEDWIEDCLMVSSHDGDFYKSGVVPNPDQGIMFLNHDWRSN